MTTTTPARPPVQTVEIPARGLIEGHFIEYVHTARVLGPRGGRYINKGGRVQSTVKSVTQFIPGSGYEMAVWGLQAVMVETLAGHRIPLIESQTVTIRA